MTAIPFGIGELAALACALLWASAVILFKQAGESLSPFALNYFKNWLCLLCLGLTALLWPGWQWQAMPTGAVLITLVSGTLGLAVADTLYFKGLNALGAGRMGIVGTAYSPSVIVLAVVFLGERLNVWQTLGVVVTLGGIVLVTWQREAAAVGVPADVVPAEGGVLDGASERFVARTGTPAARGTTVSLPLDAAKLRRGALLGGLSVFLMACGVVMAKPVLEDHDFLQVIILRMIAGVAAMSVLAVAQRRFAELKREYAAVRHWPQVLAGGFLGSYLSMIAWLAGYKYADASVAAVLNELAAVFIVIMATLLLREPLTRRQVAGSVLALAGVLVVVLAQSP